MDVRSYRTVKLVIALCGLVMLTGCLADPPAPEITNHVDDWRDEVIYQLLTDRFNDGDANNNYNVDRNALGQYHGGDFQGIIDRLDYIEALGVTTIWISPVVKNVEEDAGFSGYHGYWTQDFLSINPHFGSKAKLRELVERCHDRNIKVILDIVANHVGQLFYYDINQNGKPDVAIYGSGTTSDLQRVTEYDPDYDPRGIQSFTSLGEAGPAPVRWNYDPYTNHAPPMPVEFQNVTWFNRMGRVTDWNNAEQVVKGDFPGGLKDLDTSNPEVQKRLTEVFIYWMENFNLDGFRIDTLKHVEHEFWQYFCPAVRQRAAELGKTNFFMFGEAFDGDDELLGSYTVPNEVDSVFYFSQKFWVFDGIFKYNDPTKNMEELLEMRKRNYGDQPQPGGIGIAPQQSLVNFIDNHDLPRFLYDKQDTRALRSALSFLLTTDGVPCIYYGTEQDFSGGNDPANREDLFGGGFQTSGLTFIHTQKLISIRKQYAPLRRGDFSFRWTSERRTDPAAGVMSDMGVVAFERSYEGKSVLVVVNAADPSDTHLFSHTAYQETAGGPVSQMKVSFAPNTRLIDVLNDGNAVDQFQDNEPGYTVEPNPTAADDGMPGLVTVKVCRRCAKILVPQTDIP